MRVKWAIALSGGAAVIAQTLLIREGLALFGGYELVSGILLCFWLIWGAAGSIIFTVLNIRRTTGTYAFLLVLLSVCIFISMTIMRCAPALFGLPYGEVINLGNIVLISFIALAPPCLIFGALFPVASKLLEPERVYLLEGIGAFAGGIIFTFILIFFMSPYGIVVFTVTALLVSAMLVIGRRKAAVAMLLVLLVLTKISDIELFFRKIQMHGAEVIGLAESKYGVICVTRSKSQLNFYTNGVFDFSYPDVYSTEEAVHYAMLVHPDPHAVLLVGGGAGNCLAQILKHPSVDKVVYCELDPLLIDMAKEYIGKDFADDKRVRVVFGDARHFIKKSRRSFDVVIINLPDPVNAQLNRVYTREFFKETRGALNDGGIISVRISAPSDIISPLFGEYLNTVHRSLGSAFTYILHLPVAKITFIASCDPLPGASVKEVIKTRIRERNLQLVYVNEYLFDYSLTAERLNYVRAQIEEANGSMNRDLKPVCYYYSMILWGGVVTGWMKNSFIGLFHLNAFWFLLPLVLVFLFFRRRSLVYLSVLAIGASEISAEVILIILFQILFGFLYGWIGGIIACYMLGLAAGTFIYLRFVIFKGSSTVALSNLEICMVLYYGVIAMIAMLQPAGAYLFIPVLIFVGGFLGGLHFPLSIKAVGRRTSGIVYGIDLIGSSIGALVTAVVLIPVVGIVYTLMIFVALNLIVGIGLRIA
jgi:spermidine synthase